MASQTKKLLLTGITTLFLATGTMQAKTIKGSSDYPRCREYGIASFP
jgi:hypothetical protein